jgi:hypothetical protein
MQYGKHMITKTAAPHLMRVEVEKMRTAYRIGKTSRLFRVPEVLAHDEAKGQVTLEWIAEMQPVRRSILGAAQRGPLMERMGRVLATIHRELSLPAEMLVPLPPEFALPGTEVFLHGDFSANNVHLERRHSEIVVLDWQMTSMHGGAATHGSRYFDLIWFVNCLLWTPSARYLLGDPVAPLIRPFLESYFREAELQYDAEALACYAARFFEAKLPLRGKHATWRTRILFPRSRALTQRFIADLRQMKLGQ